MKERTLFEMMCTCSSGTEHQVDDCSIDFVCVQHGYFVGPKTVRVEGVDYTADHILVAVGGRPKMPPIEGAENCISSNGFFELEVGSCSSVLVCLHRTLSYIPEAWRVTVFSLPHAAAVAMVSSLDALSILCLVITEYVRRLERRLAYTNLPATVITAITVYRCRGHIGD